MDEAFTNISAEIEPEVISNKGSKAKYGFDPIRGEKVRMNRPKKVEGGE